MNKLFFNYLTAAMLLFVNVAVIAQQSNKVDIQESKINWIGKKPTGQHNGNVMLSGGELIVNKNEIAGGSFTIDMNSIKNSDLKDDNSNRKLVDHLKSTDFFDAKKFPTAKFSITKVSKLKNGSSAEPRKATHRIEGDLTMKGVTKKISFDASVNILNGKIAASTSEFALNRTEWGVNYQSKSVIAGLKDQFIYDDIIVSIDLVSH
jgi:polyisoprenoid-binding protein YceI